MTSEDHQAEAAERAFKTLFRRLARVAIEAGVTAPVAHRLMKEALVETAEDQFSIEGKRLTDSRISVLTGVHRKDVRTFRDAQTVAQRAEVAQKSSILSTVIGRWMGDPALRDESGAPRALPRQAETGPSFDGLVESITSDVRPRTLLDELVRKGAVMTDPETDLVTLTDTALVGGASLEDGLYFLERNVGDHIAAAAENMLAEPGAKPMIERAVFYNNLTREAVDALQTLSRARGMALLEEVNRVALEYQTAGRDVVDATERFRLGVYFYREMPPASEDDTSGKPPAGEEID